MFDAEKRTLELLLKGETVGRYTLKNFTCDTQTVWYVHGPVAYRPREDFINPDVLLDKSRKKELFPRVAKVINGYGNAKFCTMKPEKTVVHPNGKLVPMVSVGENEQLLKYVPYMDIKPWLKNKYTYVFIPEEFSWTGGTFLVICEVEGPFPIALINSFRKDD